MQNHAFAAVLEGGIMNKAYQRHVRARVDGVDCVSLIADDGDDVAKTMLELGFARVGSKAREYDPEMKKEFKAIEAQAKKNRIGMWMYGDVSEDPKDI